MRNQGKIDDKSLLILALILAKITLELDHEGLVRHVKYCSANLYDAEFFRLFKITRSILSQKSCKKISCEDWLVTQLYSVYNTGGDEFHAKFFEGSV